MNESARALTQARSTFGVTLRDAGEQIGLRCLPSEAHRARHQTIVRRILHATYLGKFVNTIPVREPALWDGWHRRAHGGSLECGSWALSSQASRLVSIRQNLNLFGVVPVHKVGGSAIVE